MGGSPDPQIIYTARRYATKSLTLLGSWVWMSFKNWSFKSSSNKMNQHDPLTLHTFYGWLAYVLFHAYHLDACEHISFGQHAHLSSWWVWYGSMIWTLLLMFKCLGNFYLKNFKNGLGKLLFHMPMSYQSHIISYFEKPYAYAACFALSFVKLLWPLEEFFSCFHDQDSRAHHIPPCYASTRS